MEIHHDKHHAAYVNNVNAALEGTDLADLPIEELLQRARPRARGQAQRGPQQRRRPLQPLALLGEHVAARAAASPSGALGDAIGSDFGSFADFQAKVKAAGVGQFGSGWAWLVHDGSGLAVVGTPNQDNPISQGKTPLLGVDVWEHAYYLLYQNRRPDYIDAWWNVVDWDVVARALRGGRLTRSSAPVAVTGRRMRRPAGGRMRRQRASAAPPGARVRCA